jgi:hypothetical protein
VSPSVSEDACSRLDRPPIRKLSEEVLGYGVASAIALAADVELRRPR